MTRKKLLEKLNKAAKKEGSRFHYEIFNKQIYREDTMNPFGCSFIKERKGE